MVPTSSLPRDNRAWYGHLGTNLWPGTGVEDPSWLRTDSAPAAATPDEPGVPAQRSGEVAATGAQTEPPAQQPILPTTGWVQDLGAIVGAAFARAQLPFSASVQDDSVAIATRAVKAHRQWFETSLVFQGHKSRQADDYPRVPTRQVAREPSWTERAALQAGDDIIYFSVDRQNSNLPSGQFNALPGSALSGETPLPSGAVLCLNTASKSKSTGFTKDQRF